jgi:mono/diheme cytochrome c family protein
VRHKLTALAILAMALAGCRGQTSSNPPIHPNPNMDEQHRYDPQEVNKLFPDQRAEREPVAGTVARGQLHEDKAFYHGMNTDGSFVWANPRMQDAAGRLDVLKRGQERFNIYCTPCHGRAGDGNGIVTPPYRVGFINPPAFTEERIRLMPDGEIFNTITNGKSTMPSYRHQVKPEDRWAIIAYIRALQRSQHTTIEEIPVEKRASVGVNP